MEMLQPIHLVRDPGRTKTGLSLDAGLLEPIDEAEESPFGFHQRRSAREDSLGMLVSCQTITSAVASTAMDRLPAVDHVRVANTLHGAPNQPRLARAVARSA